MHRLLLMLSVLFLLTPARAADWELPPVATVIAQSDAIVVARVTARDRKAGLFEQWNVQVEGTLKGTVATKLTVEQVALGDDRGEGSPFPSIPDPLGEKQVVLFLQQAKGTTVALHRYLVDGDRVVFLGDWENQKWTLGDLRTAVAQLSILQAAAKTPELATSAYRIALLSKSDEVLWWGGSALLRQEVPASLKPELEAALKNAPEKGKARKVLEQCLKKAGGNSP